MQKYTYALMVLSLLLATACGKNPTGFANQMSQSEAIGVLAQVQTEEQVAAAPAAEAAKAVTVTGLSDLIQDLVQSGTVKVPSKGRGAIQADGSVNTAVLNQVVTLLSQGKKPFAVARAVVQTASGSATQAKFDLSSIAAILTAALPFVMAIAPQFAPIIQAVITMLPIIMGFLALFGM